jgi:WD40 repeat protein
MPSSIFCIAAPEFDSSVFAAGGKDEVIHCFDASQKKELQTVRVHDNAITALCFGNRDMQLGLLDSFCTSDESKTFSRELKRKINAGELCSPRFVCSGSRDKSTVISDLVVGTVLMRFSDHQNWVRGLAVTPDGAHLVTVSDDGCCNVYNVLGKKRVKSINCHDHFATCVAVRRTGLVMATGSADTTVRVWRFQE